MGQGWARQDPGQLKNPPRSLAGKVPDVLGFCGAGRSWSREGEHSWVEGTAVSWSLKASSGAGQVLKPLEPRRQLHTLGLLARAGKVALVEVPARPPW